MAETFATGGPGKKKCTCGVFVAARVSTCPKCGHVFVSRVAEERAKKEAQRTSSEPEPDRGREKEKDLLLAGSGPCPVDLEGTDLAMVQIWADGLCDALPKFYVSRAAAKLWSRQFYPYGSAEYLLVAAHIDRCSRLHPG